MSEERSVATQRLEALGFRGIDVYLAELVPAVEMAWADGEVQPNERAVLDAYCEALVEQLNLDAGGVFFTLQRARARLEWLLRRRTTPAERHAALHALAAWTRGSDGARRRARMLEWAEAVAAVDGHPVWDTRELFWLQAVRRTLGEDARS